MRIAIQGELGSNSHMAALEVLAGSAVRERDIVTCRLSAEVFEQVAGYGVDAAVLPIENSLHGSVAEHYDLLLEQPVEIAGESTLAIRHNLIAAPGVSLTQVRRVMSHPVALSQCRGWFAAHPEVEPVPFYDTAGAVKAAVEGKLQDTAGLGPELAAQVYGGKVLLQGLEDHAENYTRFYLLRARRAASAAESLQDVSPGISLLRGSVEAPNKLTLAFSLEHRPGTLAAVLEIFTDAGLNLTRIESRPVPGSPWQYIFFVDLLFYSPAQIDPALAALRAQCQMSRELGRYHAA